MQWLLCEQQSETESVAKYNTGDGRTQQLNINVQPTSLVCVKILRVYAVIVFVLEQF